MAQNAKIKRSYQAITGQITVAPYVLSAVQISNWVSSINSANSNINPIRRKLYELYERIELDAQIETVTNLRTIAITNKKIHFYERGKEGEVNDAILEQIRSPWFNNMLRHIISSKWWGHSLIEFDLQQGLINDAILVPRFNVIPEKGLALYQSTSFNSGIAFREPPASNYAFEAKGDKKLGLYSILAPYVLYKSGGLGDWSQFCELFGIPFREFHYNPFDPESRQRVTESAESVGSAGFVVLPDGSSITIHDTNKSGSKDVFEGLIQTCDEQIAKAVLGGTMITDNGSSQAQANVHYAVKNEINLSDLIWMEYVLNFEAKQRLVNLGLPLDGGNFKFDNTREIPLEQRIEMDVKLAQQVPIADEYFYKTYGIPTPTGKAKPATENKKGGKEEPKKQ
jgi:phage gp29-like protein